MGQAADVYVVDLICGLVLYSIMNPYMCVLCMLY